MLGNLHVRNIPFLFCMVASLLSQLTPLSEVYFSASIPFYISCEATLSIFVYKALVEMLVVWK